MMQMPMAQMPMTQPMAMHDMHCDMHEYEADERDEEYFAGMHSEACHKMMPYVKRTLDKMEQKSDILDMEYPDKRIIEEMTEETYQNMIRDMPDMADEMETERQFGGRRRFARDILGLLLINQLLRRRRRRRRRHYDYWDYDNDFYFYE